MPYKLNQLVWQFLCKSEHTKNKKGRLYMNKEKDTNSNDKNNIKPKDIKGKIEIPDKRELKDGPGGN